MIYSFFLYRAFTTFQIPRKLSIWWSTDSYQNGWSVNITLWDPVYMTSAILEKLRLITYSKVLLRLLLWVIGLMRKFAISILSIDMRTYKRTLFLSTDFL